MRRIAILNQKGGVGKTTTTVNLAAALAAEGHRTLVLDLDPQAHATLHLGLLPGRSGPSLYDVLTQGLALAQVRHEVAPNLFVCGSHIDLAAAEVELIGTVGREVILRDQLDARHVGFTLDVGHLHVYGTVSPETWWVELGEGILEVHLHDNDTFGDDHMPIGEGAIDWKRTFEDLFRHAPDAVKVIEVPVEGALKSLTRIRAGGYADRQLELL